MGQGRAFKVLVGTDLLGASQRLLVGNGLHALLAERVESGGIVSQIELGADEDNRDARGVMIDLGVPLQARLAGGTRNTRLAHD